MLYLTLVTVLGFLCIVLADSSEKYGDRIVGGGKTDIEEVPWQCSLSEKGNHVCGASIIAENAILTAAHCLEGDTKAANLKVRCGSVTHDKGGVVTEVEKFIIHPMYNEESNEYDAAVAILKKPLVFNSKMKKVDLADAAPKDGSKGIASGWGLTVSNGDDLSPTLKSVVLTVQDRESCIKTAYKNNIKASMFCAGGKAGDACEGDSGGPLVDENTKKLIGTTSYGMECASDKYPGVFTSVEKILQFIKTALKSI